MLQTTIKIQVTAAQLVRCDCGGTGRSWPEQRVRGRVVPPRVECRACRAIVEPAVRQPTRALEITVPGAIEPVTYRAALVATGPTSSPCPRWTLVRGRGKAYAGDEHALHHEARQALVRRYLPGARDWAGITAGVGLHWPEVRAALAAAAAGEIPDTEALHRMLSATDPGDELPSPGLVRARDAAETILDAVGRIVEIAARLELDAPGDG